MRSGPRRRERSTRSCGIDAPSAVVANAACITASSVIVRRSSSPTIRPPRMTRTRCARPEHLLELGRDQQDRHPVRGERVDQLVDRALCADVDAARRLVRDQHARSTEEPLREQHLLLVSAGERVDRGAFAARAHVERADQLRVRRARRPATSRRTCDEVVEVRQGHVLDDRAAHQQPLALRFSGSSATPWPIAVARRARVEQPCRRARSCRRSSVDPRRRSRGRPRCGRCR